MDRRTERSVLESISREYVNPDPGRLVDQKIVSMVVDAVASWIDGPDVLEMGLGDDCWTSRVIETVGHSSVVDAADQLLAQAKSKYGDKVTVHRSFFEDFVPDKKYDTVIASWVYEHVEDPVAVMKRALGWLSAHGTMIAIVPNANSLHRRLAVNMGLQENNSDLGTTDEKMGHRRVYSHATFTADLEAAGCSILEKRGLFLKLLPQSMLTELSDRQFEGLMAMSAEIPIDYTASLAYRCVRA